MNDTDNRRQTNGHKALRHSPKMIDIALLLLLPTRTKTIIIAHRAVANNNFRNAFGCEVSERLCVVKPQPSVNSMSPTGINIKPG